MRTYRVLTGPTASGKTDWLLKRAEHVQIRVISADSRQVYRHMDIGTGKPTAEELERLPHFGINLRDPYIDRGSGPRYEPRDGTEIEAPYSAFDFVLTAARAFRELESFAGEIWVCGGTGLYIRVLLESLPLGAPPRPILREALMKRISEIGPVQVAKELGQSDRESSNPVRVLRAAEFAASGLDGARVYVYADLPATLQATDIRQGVDAGDYTAAVDYIQSWKSEGIFVLDPGVELEDLIKQRVRSMFDAGLVDEVNRLRDLGFGSSPLVQYGIGYGQVIHFLEQGYDQQRAQYHASVATRQYAKRQRTYFRGRGWPTYTLDQLNAAVPLP